MYSHLWMLLVYACCFCGSQGLNWGFHWGWFSACSYIAAMWADATPPLSGHAGSGLVCSAPGLVIGLMYVLICFALGLLLVVCMYPTCSALGPAIGTLHVAVLLCSGTAIGMMYVHRRVSLPRSTHLLAQARKQVERGGGLLTHPDHFARISRLLVGIYLRVIAWHAACMAFLHSGMTTRCV